VCAFVLCIRICVRLRLCVGNQQRTGCLCVHLCIYVCVRLGAYALVCVGNQRASARIYVCVLVSNNRVCVCGCMYVCVCVLCVRVVCLCVVCVCVLCVCLCVVLVTNNGPGVCVCVCVYMCACVWVRMRWCVLVTNVRRRVGRYVCVLITNNRPGASVGGFFSICAILPAYMCISACICSSICIYMDYIYVGFCKYMSLQYMLFSIHIYVFIHIAYMLPYARICFTNICWFFG